MVEVSLWDPSEALNDEETIAEYIAAALETGDSELIKIALNNVVRARGMTQVANDSGLARQSLYKALSQSGNPSFETLNKIMAALGLRLSAVPA